MGPVRPEFVEGRESGVAEPFDRLRANGWSGGRANGWSGDRANGWGGTLSRPDQPIREHHQQHRRDEEHDAGEAVREALAGAVALLARLRRQLQELEEAFAAHGLVAATAPQRRRSQHASGSRKKTKTKAKPKAKTKTTRKTKRS